MKDGLSNLDFKGGSSDFIKFVADKPIKLRVLTLNPLVSNNSYTNEKTGEVTVSTKYGFAVWNYTEDRAMILNATPSIAQTIHRLHTDEDYGEDVTKLDIKIEPTGEMLERRYTINVLPKSQKLTDEQETAVLELDGKLDSIIKNGIRADEYNEGKRNKAPEDEIIEDDGTPIDLGDSMPPEFLDN